MASAALGSWRKERSERLDELVEVHRRATGKVGKGRRHGTEQLNWSIVLRIAAEFQGFTIDLHDAAADEIIRRVGEDCPPASQLLQALLTRNRELSRGNASVDNLVSDYRRLGITDLRAALAGRDTRNKGRLRHVEWLIKARDGIIHDNRSKLGEVRKEGYQLQRLSAAKSWRQACDRLAPQMDGLLSGHVRERFGGTYPW